MDCEHQNFFANVEVARLEDVGLYQADIRIKCEDCGLPFLFMGLRQGLDLSGSAMSFDREEARLAIEPRHKNDGPTPQK